MSAWSNFKRDITKHRSKAAILGILFVTMVAMGIRAAVVLRPRTVAASGAIPTLPLQPPVAGTQDQLTPAEAQARIQQSKLLWHTLREVKASATPADAAFSFDAIYYPAPPQIVEPVKPPVIVGPTLPVVNPIPAPIIESATSRANRIREQGRALIVKSTAVGDGTTEPMAIVNQQLVTVGQTILGFEVIAIRSREVEFRKEGETYVGKMPDGQ
jgi:hypothetical protein